MPMKYGPTEFDDEIRHLGQSAMALLRDLQLIESALRSTHQTEANARESLIRQRDSLLRQRTDVFARQQALADRREQQWKFARDLTTIDGKIYDLSLRLDKLESARPEAATDPVCGCRRNGFECDGSCEEYEDTMNRLHDPAPPALPTPAPVDDICKCGHLRGMHDDASGCTGRKPFSQDRCACLGFLSPTVAPVPPLDPVLVAIAEAYRLIATDDINRIFDQPRWSVAVSLNHAFADQSGRQCETIPAEEMLAYVQPVTP